MEIFGHGDVTGVCGVVPVDDDSTEEGTSPVNGDGVEFLEGLDGVEKPEGVCICFLCAF